MQSHPETDYGRRLPALLVANLCVLIALVCLARAGTDRSKWRAVGLQLDEFIEEDALIVVHPGIDRLFAHFLRHEAVVPADRWRADYKRFNQVAGLSVRGPFPAYLRRTISRHFGEASEHTLSPGTELVVWERERRIAERGDLITRLDSARVYIDRNDARIDCPQDGRRHVCPDADWTWVGPTQMSIANEPVTCVWSHPVNGKLTVDFTRLGSWDALDGWWGLSDYAADHAEREATTLTLAAGEDARSFRLVRTRGRRALSMELPEDFDGRLRLELETAAPGARHLCWSLHLLRYEEGAEEDTGDETDDDPGDEADDETDDEADDETGGDEALPAFDSGGAGE